MPDVYDQEIAYLTDRPDQIYHHWNRTSPLFQRAARPNTWSVEDRETGCLTQIRTDTNQYRAETMELTTLIQQDERIPLSPTLDQRYESSCNIKVEHLTVFAEWQRKLDIELNRNAPEDFRSNL